MPLVCFDSLQVHSNKKLNIVENNTGLTYFLKVFWTLIQLKIIMCSLANCLKITGHFYAFKLCLKCNTPQYFCLMKCTCTA